MTHAFPSAQIDCFECRTWILLKYQRGHANRCMHRGQSHTSQVVIATMMNKSCKWGQSSNNWVHIPVVSPNWVNKDRWLFQNTLYNLNTLMVAHGKETLLSAARPTHGMCTSMEPGLPNQLADHLEQSSLVKCLGLGALTRTHRSVALLGTLPHERPNTWLS